MQDTPGFIYSDQPASRGEREVVGFGSSLFHVKTLNRAVANTIILQRHYSGTFCRGSRIHLGIYSPELMGVLQLGPAMNPASQASVVADTQPDEYLELNRMWLDDALPRNSETRALSMAFTYVKRRFPRVAWIQSFADERCGRYGVVYQAANFLFCGEHTSVFWELDGVMYHNSLMTRNPELTPKAKRVQDGKARAVPHRFRQFRYVYFLKKPFVKRLRHKVRPYPKHAPEVSVETRHVANAEGQGQFLHGAPILP